MHGFNHVIRIRINVLISSFFLGLGEMKNQIHSMFICLAVSVSLNIACRLLCIRMFILCILLLVIQV